jgi:hypothetical protein
VAFLPGIASRTARIPAEIPRLCRWVQDERRWRINFALNPF